MPSVVHSKDQNLINATLEKIQELEKLEISMDATNKLLSEFESIGGIKKFIDAIKFITGRPQTIGNCWIKSYNEALEIRMFIGFLKAYGFNFDSQQEGDDLKIEAAKKRHKHWLEKFDWSV